MSVTKTTRIERIAESLSPAAKIDRALNVIRGVKLIGFESKNNRIYPPKVLKEAVHLYEGAKVNIDHPERGPGQERKYMDRFGAIKNVRFVEGQGLFGDFHFNPHHPQAEQVLWDAENNPEALGFSHNATLRLGRPQNGKEVIESIVQIRSMDLVADPATTSSLFESEQMDDMPAPAAAATETDPKAAMKGAFRQMIMAAVDDESLDMKSTLKKISEIMKSQEKLMGGGAAPVADDAEEAYGKDEKKMAEESYKQTISALTQRLEQYEAKEKQATILKSIETALVTEGLDPKNPVHCSELFNKQLLATESEADRLALIKDRASLVGVTRRTESVSTPAYRPQTTDALEQIDAKAFASRLLHN